MSPVSTSVLRAMRGAPVLAAMRAAMERAEAAGRSKAESLERAAPTKFSVGSSQKRTTCACAHVASFKHT